MIEELGTFSASPDGTLRNAAGDAWPPKPAAGRWFAMVSSNGVVVSVSADPSMMHPVGHAVAATDDPAVAIGWTATPKGFAPPRPPTIDECRRAAASSVAIAAEARRVSLSARGATRGDVYALKGEIALKAINGDQGALSALSVEAQARGVPPADLARSIKAARDRWAGAVLTIEARTASANIAIAGATDAAAVRATAAAAIAAIGRVGS